MQINKSTLNKKQKAKKHLILAILQILGVEMWITSVFLSTYAPIFNILHKNKRKCINIYLWKCG